MKKIISFKINGFKAKDRIAEVIFSKENVTIIYGDNGSGKTTFLKTIFLFLSQDEDSLKSMNVQSIECSVLIDDETQTILVKSTEDGYDWNEFDDSCFYDSKSMSLGVERGITQSMKIESGLIFRFFSSPYYRHRFRESAQFSSRHDLQELSEQLSDFLNNRNKKRLRISNPELDCSEAHLHLQNIKIENIEELLLRRYILARITTTQKIQKALFETLSVAIITKEENKERVINLPENFKTRLIESKDRIIEALDIAAIARSANIKLMIGCMLESVLAMSASVHFAAGLGGFSFVDLDPHSQPEKELFTGGPEFKSPVYLLTDDNPGIGVFRKG